MRTLKTPEEIICDYEEVNRSMFTHPKGIIEMIRTAQRDALECMKIHIEDNILENGLVNRVMENLLPKE